MRLVILTTLLTSICLPTWGNSAIAQGIKTYERRFIGDVGYAEVDRRGNAVVVMNPAACRRLGPDLCSFFKAHEMAHHQLKHFDRNISVQQKEAEADRYAASVVSPAARSAAQKFFASGQGGGSKHGTSQQRLARVSVSRMGVPKKNGQRQTNGQVATSSQANVRKQTTAVSKTTTGGQVTSSKIAIRSMASDRLNATRSVPIKWIRVPSCRK